MSSLNFSEQHHVEKILDMSGGFVLDFTDATFAAFFKRHGIDIHGTRYQTYGISKAKKMRGFWEREPDRLVGQVLSELLDYYEAQCESGVLERNPVSLQKSRESVARLCGEPISANSTPDEEFLRREFEIPNIQNLPVDFAVYEIIEDRVKEAQSCLSNGAHLSVIFQCGSVLEAVLLGAAQKEPERFNRSSKSPRQHDKVKRFQDWKLAEFIDVACDIGLLVPDVQTFCHGLRDFRNYIHPYEQMASGFKPDEHTAKICFQVLKAALAGVAGYR